MAHDNHWKATWDQAHERLETLFSDSGMKLSNVIGDEDGIDSYCDAKKALAFVFAHHPSFEEKACAILSTMQALMAWHELNEHKNEAPSARTGVLVK